MSLPVTVYRWDDPGAPQLVLSDIKPSNWIDILKKCLIDGYGAKAGLGWTMPFVSPDGFTTVFRNSSSEASGSYMQVKCRTGSDPVGGHVNLQTAPLLSEYNPNWETINCASKQYTFGGNFRITKWCLIGTSAGFYLFGIYATKDNMAMGTYSHVSFFCGDIDSFVPNDLNRFTVLSQGAATGNSSAGWNHSLSYCSNITQVGNMHETGGAELGKVMEILSRFPTATTTSINGVPSDFRVYSHPILAINGVHVVSSAGVNADSVGERVIESSLHPGYRGHLPGYIQTQVAKYSDQLWPQTQIIDGQEYWLIHAAHNGACNFWVNMESWYG
ncbi:conserved protein of unknown function [Shewanella benthica]|uniref:Uncharacterized protein n=1 Tax=Shewanella benthica TaxID=43661 RepID=A0A330M4R0_9GAMM|nr:hypothetical protein [Shewanella benthica]SQH76935.1 conserved protein of unknown function [Shewanella benthica]